MDSRTFLVDSWVSEPVCLNTLVIRSYSFLISSIWSLFVLFLRVRYVTYARFKRQRHLRSDMKRLLLFVAALAMSISVSAQSSGIRLGVSGVNAAARSLLLTTRGDTTPYSLGSVYDEVGDLKGYGSVCIGYVYEPGGRFSFAADLQYSPFVRTVYRGRTGAVTGTYIAAEMFSLSGIFRWSYIKRPHFSMYVGGGPMVFVTNNLPIPLVLAQLNPICFSAGGERLRVFMEAGYGAMFTGAQIGVSYIFK